MVELDPFCDTGVVMQKIFNNKNFIFLHIINL
jgi:hypothetical protein